MKVIDTDNFDSDYPNEKVVASGLTFAEAQQLANEKNTKAGPFSARYYMVKPDDYVLRPGFEP